MQGILEGTLDWDEGRKQEDAIVQLRREFKKDKLKKLLIQHRLRLCTITKKEYVSISDVNNDIYIGDETIVNRG